MATQDVVQGSSVQVGSTPATISTGTSGGSAGNNNTTSTSAGTNPTAAPVVAPKGFRLVLQQMLQGWQAVIPSGSALASSSGMLAQAAVLEQLQEYLGPYGAMDAQATAYKQSRAQVEGGLVEARQYIAVLKLAVQNAFGPASPQLTQFGVKPRKAPKPLTSAQKAVRAAKAKATRALRGTKGSVQKAAIKSGPMQFVQPVPAEPDPSPAAATPDPVASGSPPASK